MTRGGHLSPCNCPHCLAKAKGMASLGEVVLWRTPENMQDVLTVAWARPAGAKEEVLKEYGLRDADVCYFLALLCIISDLFSECLLEAQVHQCLQGLEL